MKLNKAGGAEARLRQSGSLPDDLNSVEIGQKLLSSFERLQPKKGAKDSEACVRTGDHNADRDESKYDKAKIPRSLILVLLLLVVAVVVLTHLATNLKASYDEPHQRSFPSVSGRPLRDVRSGGCRKTASSMRVELKYSGFGNAVTSCDLPKGASLLGLLQLKRHRDALKIGLVNIDEEEQQNWHQFTLGWAKYHVFPFEPVQKSLQWSDFYPEWIDENSSPTCPHLPLPSMNDHEGIKLNAVIVKAPCGSVRDVGRLQTLLAAASVASMAGGDLQNMLVLVISDCRPLVNLFSCDELVEQQGDLWLFEVNLARMRHRLALPVGSCELSVRLKNNVIAHKKNSGTRKEKIEELLESVTSKLSKRRRREAYATLLHSAGQYVCGAIAAAQSIRATGSQQDLVALVDESISAENREALQQAGWKLKDIERIRNPKSDPHNYNTWNYSKFRLWQLVQYDKIVYIDADLLVLQNLDFLFDMAELSATGNDKSLFNSGVMVIEPSNCTFDLLMDQIDEIYSYNGGDQGYLNEIFPWWHRLPKSVNFLKHFWSNKTAEREEKTRLFQATDPSSSLHVIHYLGKKPWLCYRDYDCNWDAAEYRVYASDAAHARWWAVHDAMPVELQRKCLLSTKQKANIEYSRRKAKEARFQDEHWNANITDPRLHICTEKFCNWEIMLRHWGEPAATPVTTRLQL